MVRVHGTRCFLKVFKEAELFDRTLHILRTLERDCYKFVPNVIAQSEKGDGPRIVVLGDLGPLTFLKWRTLDKASAAKVAREAGEALAQLHALRIELQRAGQINVRRTIVETARTIEALLENDITRNAVGTARLPDTLRSSILEICDETRGVVEGGTDLASASAFVHGDCWAPNCIIAMVSNVVQFGGFVDFDYGGMGNAALDTFRMFTRGTSSENYVSVRQLPSPSLFWHSFVSGYCEHLELPAMDESTSMQLLLFYLLRTAEFYMALLLENSDVAVAGLRMGKLTDIAQCCSELLKNPSFAAVISDAYNRR